MDTACYELAGCKACTILRVSFDGGGPKKREYSRLN